MAETLLEMRHVTKRFPGVIALDDVNLDLRKGEILGMCGENGAGKSTLMKVLSGSYSSHEYEGQILIDQKPQAFQHVSMAQKAGIEMVYQEMNMMLDASVAENLFVGNLPGKHGWVDYKTLYADTRNLLEQAGLALDPKETVRPLNSGQMQMLSLMRAVAKNPRILVLDEPTTALTDSEVEIMMKLLKNLRRLGISCIYISHKLEEIHKLCDRVVVLRDGHTISCYEIDDVVESRLIEDMVGRKVENLYPKEHHVVEGNEVFRVEHLSVPHPNIRGKYIVEDISFHVKKGEILGIGGLVGAGRSECLGALFGQYTNHVKKEVYIRGKKVEINSPKDAIAQGMGFVTEERKRNGIIWMLSIRENISVASLDKISKGLFLDQKKENREVQTLSAQLRIKAPDFDTKLIQLSGGNQQKVILAKWLFNNPDILFVDEPTKGIDVGTKADFYRLMNNLTKQGVSIVMVSSDMPELVAMSDRCIVISNGHITGELEKNEINEINIMRAAIAE